MRLDFDFKLGKITKLHSIKLFVLFERLLFMLNNAQYPTRPREYIIVMFVCS